MPQTSQEAALQPQQHASTQAQRRIWLLLIIVGYLAVATLYAVQVPAWQAPDEPAHYNYVHELATGAGFPVLRMGDYDQAYLERLKSERFPPTLSIAPVRYEAHQPPLYYLLQAMVFTTARGELLALRLMSVALGALFIWLIYEIARLIVAGRPAIWLGAAAFVAFLPMHVAISASVNNDALAEVLLAGILLLSIRYLKRCLVDHDRPTWLDALAIGVLLGLALVTKVSAYVAAPAALAAPLICWFEARRRGQGEGSGEDGTEDKGNLDVYPSQSPRSNSQSPIPGSQLARHLLLIALPALLIALPWYVRNAVVYGNLDILGRQWHDAVVVGQLRTSELLAEVGPDGVLTRFLTWSHASFWGVFGWMGVWMDGRIYTLLLAWSLAVVVGLVALAGKEGGSWKGEREGRSFRFWSLILLGLAALLTIVIYVSYNVIFVQPQGRYLFPALPALALAVALGWRTALQPRVTRWAGLVLVAAAAVAVAWGVLDQGVNRWSLAIFAGGAAAALAWSVALPRLAPDRQRLLATAAYGLPFLALLALDLFALRTFILPQLG